MNLADAPLRPKGQLMEERLRAAAAHAERGAPEPPSLAQRIANLPPYDRERVIGSIPVGQTPRVLRDWRVFARPTQLAPAGNWSTWLCLCGRGWGKTLTGAQFVKECEERGEARAIGLIGPTSNDTWNDMIEGTEQAPGLARLYEHLPRHQRPTVNHQKMTIQFDSGAIARVFTAEKPEIRGFNADLWWCDELAKWKWLRTTYTNIRMTLRVKGRVRPRMVITTTPRPLELIKELLDDEYVHFTYGSTYANAANLAPEFILDMRKKFQSSRLGLQELMGLVLGDNPDSLFLSKNIEAARVDEAPRLVRIVVSVDPAISRNQRSDLTGIVVLGICQAGDIYVLADLTGKRFDREAPGLVFLDQEGPLKHSPEEWADLAVRAYDYFKADAIVGERNRGGDLVAAVIKAALHKLRGPKATIPIEEVIATRGKDIRAEPVATMVEQGRVHCVGLLADLEDEMQEFNPKLPGPSPNRLDALVWGVYSLAELNKERTPQRVPDVAGLRELQRSIPSPTFSTGTDWNTL